MSGPETIKEYVGAAGRRAVPLRTSGSTSVDGLLGSAAGRSNVRSGVVWRNACQLQAEVKRALRLRGAGACARPLSEAVVGR
eukprot:6337970-Pyramimonas_sp.AAC.1